MWKKFDESKDYKIVNDVLIIKPSDKNDIVPLFCSVCEFPMKTSDDFLSFKDNECCYKCNFYLAAKYREQWNNGWRPEKDSEEFKKYMEFRNESFKPTIRFS